MPPLRVLLRLLPGLAALAAGPPAGAAGKPETTFYETATVVARPLATATGAVTVLDRAAIERSGARTAAELLRFVPGLDVTANGPRGGLTTAQIRGGDPNFTLVLLDGVPLNDSTSQVGDVANLEALPAFAIERIEVVRGPLSAVYGSTGLAGAIQIVSRRGEAGPLRSELETSAGNADLRQVQGSVSGALGPQGAAAFFVGGSWEREEERVAAERFRQGNLHLNFTGPRLRVKSRYTSWQGDDYPDASGGPVYGTGELRRSDQRELSLGAELGTERRKLTLAFYRHELDRKSPAVGFAVPASREETAFTTARLGWASVVFDRPGSRLAAGVDAQREKAEVDSALLLPPEFGGDAPGSYRADRDRAGAFAEWTAARGNLGFEASSRIDAAEEYGEQWSPRLGASWRPGGGPARWRASAGRAWKLPSFFALASPPALGGNPDLRPESVLGGDLGYERSWAARRLDASITLFYNRFRDLIDFDFATFRHVNRSEVEARGAEFAASWQPAAAWQLSANATWQQVEDSTSASRLRHRPKWVGGLRIGWHPDERLGLQLDGQGTARSFDEQIPVPDRETVPGYGLLGLAGTWQLGTGWQLRGRIDNLTDRRYETLIGFPGAGRAVRLGLRWSAAP